MSDSKVQPETSAECSLRDRYAEALLAEGVFLHPRHVSEETRQMFTAARLRVADAVLAVRDDVLAEKDAEIESVRARGDGLQRQVNGWFARAEAAEAGMARLRETVGRVEAAARFTEKDIENAQAAIGEGEWQWFQWLFGEKIRAALAPRESATEAPRTRDGEQECTGASGCCTACNGTGGGEIGGSCWDCRGTGHPHPPLDGDGERCGSGTPPVSVPDIAAPSVAANDDEQGEWGDDDLPTPDEALRMGWTV